MPTPDASDDRSRPSGEPPAHVGWQTWHGAVLIAALLAPAFVPALSAWPFYLLAPLVLYGAFVLLIAPLRHVPDWCRVGRLSPRIGLAMAIIIVISSAGLAAYDWIFSPDLQDLAGKLASLGMPFAVGILVFSSVNALLEEVIFRGILHDAFLAQFGPRAALFIQAVVFGLGHANGYPPGPAGTVLAFAYGIMLGLLRQRSGGLAAAWVCHVCADATIFIIVLGN